MRKALLPVLVFWGVAVWGGPLTLLSPRGGEIWQEGRTYPIRWQSDLQKGYLCIEAAIGGHPRGIVNDCATPIREGKFLWKIPRGFVSDFGISEDRHVRLMLWPKENPEQNLFSPEFTVVKGPLKRRSSRASEAEIREMKIIRQYFDDLKRGKYARAYRLRSRCRITFTAPDGTGISYMPAPPYRRWLHEARTLATSRVLRIRPLPCMDAAECRCAANLGIHRYEVTLQQRHRKSTLIFTVAGLTKAPILDISANP